MTDPKEADVEAINYQTGCALLSDGQIITITNWIDDEGEECSPDEAVAAVAGPTSDAKWVAIDLAGFEPLSETGLQ